MVCIQDNSKDLVEYLSINRLIGLIGKNYSRININITKVNIVSCLHGSATFYAKPKGITTGCADIWSRVLSGCVSEENLYVAGKSGCVSEEYLSLAGNRIQVSQPLDSHSTISASHWAYKSRWNESALVTLIVLACLQNKRTAGEVRDFYTIRWSRLRFYVVECYHAGKKYVCNDIGGDVCACVGLR